MRLHPVDPRNVLAQINGTQNTFINVFAQINHTQSIFRSVLHLLRSQSTFRIVQKIVLKNEDLKIKQISPGIFHQMSALIPNSPFRKKTTESSHQGLLNSPNGQKYVETKIKLIYLFFYLLNFNSIKFAFNKFKI